MKITRRSVCAGVTVSAALTTLAIAVPASTQSGEVPAHRLLAQLAPAAPPPSQDDLRDQKAFEYFLVQRIRRRTESVGVMIESDANPEIEKFASQAAAAAFEKERPGRIGKEKDYRVLPTQVRRVIIIRNYDDLTDILIAAAAEGRRITQAVVSNVRDFICPLYPFC